MKKVLFLSFLLAIFVMANISTATAQKEVVKKLEKKEVKASRGDNAKIKDKDVCNAPLDEVRDSKKSRGSCEVIFKNYFYYFRVNIWIDGYYYGQLPPRSEITITVGSGWTEIYCETHDATYYWEASGDCNDKYIFNLE